MESADRSQRVGRRGFLKGVAAGAMGLGLSGSLARDVRADEAGAATASGKVKTATFGRTGVPISRIMVGGGPLRPDRYRMLQAAYDRGIFGIDVAQIYGDGKAEEAVGSFLANFQHRDKLFICTKASRFRKPQGSSKAVYDAFKENLQTSLRRMKTDYVDLLLWPHGADKTDFLDDEAVREAMQKVKEEKLVRFFGFSSHKNYRKVCDAGIRDGFYDVILTVINICTQNPEKAGETTDPRMRERGRRIEDTRELLALAKKKNVGIMAMKVAKGGYLGPGTDRLLAGSFPEGSTLSRHQKLYTYGMDLPGVSTVVVGMGNVTHLKEAVEIGAA